MSPPCPPSPPDGPPRGTYFSLRNATQPSPPSPAFTMIFASSANTIWPPKLDERGFWERAYARVAKKNKKTRPGPLERVSDYRETNWQPRLFLQTSFRWPPRLLR